MERRLIDQVEALTTSLVLATLDAGAARKLATEFEDVAAALDRAGEARLASSARTVAAALAATGGGGTSLEQAMRAAAVWAEEFHRAAAGARPGPAAEHAPAGGKRDAETAEILTIFVQETTDEVTRADELLIEGERAGFSDEAIHELFRLFHSIKGLAGHLAEISDIAVLAHAAESLLDLVREGQVELRGPPLDLMFETSAMMRKLVETLRGALAADIPVPRVGELAPLLEQLGAMTGEAAHGPAPAPVRAEAAPAHPAGPKGNGQDGHGGRGPADMLRVDATRVDALMEMVGELVIVESMIAHSPEIATLAPGRIQGVLSQFGRISRDLQALALRMRMVTVGTVFRRMGRLVRELAHQAGKDVELRISGETTEIDRAMTDGLEEPLVHLLRNAVDHGVETPEERARAGKPPTAVIRLHAHTQGGCTHVEVSDDGRGLQRQAILERARARGLMGPEDRLADGEVERLIFEPGFSTAREVTDISGRGVGMDVVKRHLESLRGRVEVRSTEGQGTTFRLVLPLTLAIIDGMVVRCGEERFIVPSLAIAESIRLDPRALAAPAGQDELLDVRGELIPVVRLAQVLRVTGADRESARPIAVLVEGRGRRVALLVDAVVSQQQVVIKPLSRGTGNADAYSGAAILSDGRVALILNVEKLLARRGAPRAVLPPSGVEVGP